MKLLNMSNTKIDPQRWLAMDLTETSVLQALCGGYSPQIKIRGVNSLCVRVCHAVICKYLSCADKRKSAKWVTTDIKTEISEK